MSQPPLAKSEIPPGTLIDNRYMIQRILGQGGLGRTYLAHDTRRFNEPCVLKEFAPSGTGEHGLEKSRNLFKREAKILHQIEHPQIPKFLACFEGDGRLFLVQEFVDGKAYSTLLRERQSQGNAFTEDEVLHWLKRLLPVLEYIHDNNIIHRDISPDNIMLPNGKDVPVLIDFGVGKQMAGYHHDDDEPVSPNQKSYVGRVSLVGKVGYAPREQISLGICSPSSDLYALGVTAVVLLTGRDPSLLMDQYSLEWRWRLYSRVSDDFARVIDRMLADTPRDRYQASREVLFDLEHLGQFEQFEQFEQYDPFDQPGATVVSTLPSALQGTPRSAPVAPPPPRQPIPTVVSSTGNLGNPNSGSSNHLGSSAHTGHRRSEPPVSALSPAFIERCQHELAYCIGPMASLIMEEVLESAPATPQQMVEILAQEIPDPHDANEFRRRMFT